MKKLSIILFMLFSVMFTYSLKVEVTKLIIVRSAVEAKDNVGVAKVGQVFDVLKEIGSWHKVQLKNGKVGYVWQKLINDTIFIKDANLHIDPITASEVVCTVTKGTTYDLIKINTKWYKIGSNRYIYYYNTKKLE